MPVELKRGQEAVVDDGPAQLARTTPGAGCVLRDKVPRFRSAATITSEVDHSPNNHTLARAATERMRDFRHRTGTREDLFRPPRVRV